MTALVARASNPMTIIPIRFDLIHSPTLQCKVYCGVAPCASFFLLIGLAPWLCRFPRFLLFVTFAHGIQARATFANGDQSACGHRPDYSCLVAKWRATPALGFDPPNTKHYRVFHEFRF